MSEVPSEDLGTGCVMKKFAGQCGTRQKVYSKAYHKVYVVEKKTQGVGVAKDE